MNTKATNEWLRWHLFELAAVIAPAVLAAASGMWWLLAISALFATRWARHEVTSRPQRTPAYRAEQRRREPSELIA